MPETSGRLVLPRTSLAAPYADHVLMSIAANVFHTMVLTEIARPIIRPFKRRPIMTAYLFRALVVTFGQRWSDAPTHSLEMSRKYQNFLSFTLPT